MGFRIFGGLPRDLQRLFKRSIAFLGLWILGFRALGFRVSGSKVLGFGVLRLTAAGF